MSRIGIVSVLAVLLSCLDVLAQETKKADEFTKTTIDLGVVVSDVEKAVKFYTEVVGFQEIKGFEVPADYAKDVGLTNGKAVKVRIMVLGESDAATKIKLIEFPGEKPKKNDSEFVNSELGFRYLTIFVTDMNAAMKRLDKAGVKPLAKGPQLLPKEFQGKKGFADDLQLLIVRDPDGNLVELVGPKK